jgi:hypothetical protein
MSNHIEWIRAEGDPDYPAEGLVDGTLRLPSTKKSRSEEAASLAENLPVHNFPGRPNWGLGWEPDDPLDRNPFIGQYRERTVALLRRYMRLSLETGRLPSMVGKEFFRAKVTAYRSVTFEDRVIFVSDVEKILERLEYWDQQLIARMILQEHGQEKTARLLHCNRSTICRRLPEVLDLLSEGFLEVGLLVAVPTSRKN